MLRWRREGAMHARPISRTRPAAAQASGGGARRARWSRRSQRQATAAGNWLEGAADNATWRDGARRRVAPSCSSANKVRPTAKASTSASGSSRWAASIQPAPLDTSTGWAPRADSAMRPSSWRSSTASPGSIAAAAMRLPQRC